jgi:hypothetical protein
MKMTSAVGWVMTLVVLLGLPAGSCSQTERTTGSGDVAKTLKAAADALGMARWSGLGGGELPEIDVVNRVDFRATGSTYGSDEEPALTTEYHCALSYNPPAMRVEMTRTVGTVSQHTIQTVRENYAWNESELGGGLEPGRGTATPDMAALKQRLLQLWILPYGVVKASSAAGDKTKVSKENGNTVISFPLTGELSGITVRATLDDKNLIAKVETQADNRSLSRMDLETQYSNYADLGEAPTEVLFPAHIVQKQGGHKVMDIQVKSVDISPYLVFPVPPNVRKEALRQSAVNK